MRYSNFLPQTAGIILLTSLFVSAVASDQHDVTLETSAQQAKEEGMRLYGIRWRSVAIPHLEKAAEAGDVESMYYLGEIHRFMDRGMSREAIDWYHRAALGGDPHAMLRLEWGMICELADLCPEDHDTWVDKALEQELPKAEAGDTEAMIALRSIYAVLEQPDTAEQWLRKAAEAGNPHAQDWWARSIQNRSGELPPKLEDVKAAEPWFRKAAEQGYAPAMHHLVSNLVRQRSTEDAWEWVVKGSKSGHVRKRITYAVCQLAPEDLIYCHPAEADPVKGWAILLALDEETRTDSAQWNLDYYADRLDDDEKAEAEKLAEDWLNRDPPLSYFPPKYGF